MSIGPKWSGLRAEAREALAERDYSALPPAERLERGGFAAGDLLAARAGLPWIPGVELIARTVHPQRFRGHFGELGRAGEGVLGEIGFWPPQWAAATMHAGTAKGFHIHPPHIPHGETPEAWLARLFGPGTDLSQTTSLRPYAKEQWDVMFFISGRAEMWLIDERAGLDRRRMRFFVDGDNHRGPHNVAVVIPPGVAHAIRSEGSEDLVMVYGTSTTFDPTNEGRISHNCETSTTPAGWDPFWD